MRTVVVGIGDCRLERDPDSQLVTYALGSCIALTVYDPVTRVGGLLHYMLPEAGPDPVKAKANPFMYADSGIPLLFRRAMELGAEKRRLVVTATGGAQMMDQGGLFNIGKRNCLEMRKILWKAGVSVKIEDVGGSVSRTVRMDLNTGRVLLRMGLQEREFLAAQRAA
jgi:chemotaxis protein CheD